MHVVIVGAGFGGIKAALELSKRQVGRITLISDQEYFLHHATLYATATGKSTEESVIPLNTIFAHHPQVNIVSDFITSFDPQRKLISSKKRDYHYDKLILALGSVTTFHGIKGLEEHAYGIKTLEEVREFQNHIHEEVVNQRLDKEYFVVGGGLSGVEMASALNEHLLNLKMVYRLKRANPRVTLVEATERIVPTMSRAAARKISHQLTKQGIKIVTKERVSELTDSKITVGSRIYPTTTAIWTSGTANNPFYKDNSGYFNFSETGRVEVNPYLEALEHVYVIGDNNSVTHSGMALPALKQATHVAKNIARVATKRPQKRFRSTQSPMSLPVGSRWGYAEWRGVYVSGRLGAVVRRWMELHGYCQLVPFSVAVPIWRSHDVKDVDDIF